MIKFPIGYSLLVDTVTASLYRGKIIYETHQRTVEDKSIHTVDQSDNFLIVL